MKFIKDSTVKYGETLVLGDFLRLDEDADGRTLIRATGASGVGIILDDLADVTISSPATEQFLGYNGASWVNTIINSGVLPSNGNYLRLDGSTPMAGNLNMQNYQISWTASFGNALVLNNNTIIGVNNLAFGDPGPNEGLEWAAGSGWRIFEAPNNFANAGGNLHVVLSGTRIATWDILGGYQVGNITINPNNTAKILIDGADGALSSGEIGFAENVGELWIGARSTVRLLMDDDDTGTGNIWIGKGVQGSTTGFWQFDISGDLYAISDNLYDIGQSGTNRPRSLYLAGEEVIGTDPGGTNTLRVNKSIRASNEIISMLASGTQTPSAAAAIMFGTGSTQTSHRGGFGFNAYWNGATWVLPTDSANSGGQLLLGSISGSGWEFFTILSSGSATQNIPNSEMAALYKRFTIGTSTITANNISSFVISTDPGGGALLRVGGDARLRNLALIGAGTGEVNGAIEMGRTDGVASTPFIDFHAGATVVDFDARIAVSAGTGAIGSGTISVTSATNSFSAQTFSFTSSTPVNLGTTNSTNLNFKTGNTTRWVLDNNGHWVCLADNVYDIGRVATNRPRNLYLGGLLTIGSGGFDVIDSSAISSPGNANVGLRISAAGNSTATGHAYLWLDGDTNNDPSEAGGSYVKWTIDNGGVGAWGIAGMSQTSNFLPDHSSYTGIDGNSFVVAAVGTLAELQFGCNGLVRGEFLTNGTFRIVSGANSWFTVQGTSGGVTILTTTESVLNAKRSDTGIVGYEFGSSDATGGSVYIDLCTQSGVDFNTRLIRTVGVNGALQIINSGTGAIEFHTDKIFRWSVTGAGNLLTNADNTYDIGLSASNRARDLFLGRNATTGGNVTVGTLGTFLGSSNPQIDNILIYSGTNWVPRYFQPSFTAGQVVATNLGDSTSATYVNDGRTPTGSPTAPNSSQDPVATAHYRAIMVDMSAYGTLPSDKVFVLDYSVNGGAYTTNAIISTSNKVVHSNLNPASTYTYKYKIRGSSDSVYSDPSNTVAPSNNSEVNAFGVVIASQIATANLSAISANIGDIAAGQIRNPANTIGILVSGTLPGSWTTYLNLMATGSSPLLHHPGLDLLANGSAIFSGTITAGYITMGSGYVNSNLIISNSLTVNDGLTKARAGLNVGNQDQLLISMNNPTGSQWAISNSPSPVGLSYGLDFGVGGSLSLSLNSSLFVQGIYSPGGYATGYYPAGIIRNTHLIDSGVSINSGTIGCGGDIWNPLIIFSGSGTQTVDWRRGNVQKLILKGTGQTIRLAKGNVGGVYTLIVFQDPVGNRTITTWTSDDPNTNVIWNNPGTTPTLATGANDADIFTFVKVIGSGTNNHYLGVVGGQYLL